MSLVGHDFRTLNGQGRKRKGGAAAYSQGYVPKFDRAVHSFNSQSQALNGQGRKRPAALRGTNRVMAKVGYANSFKGGRKRGGAVVMVPTSGEAFNFHGQAQAISGGRRVKTMPIVQTGTGRGRGYEGQDKAMHLQRGFGKRGGSDQTRFMPQVQPSPAAMAKALAWITKKRPVASGAGRKKGRGIKPSYTSDTSPMAKAFSQQHVNSGFTSPGTEVEQHDFRTDSRPSYHREIKPTDLRQGFRLQFGSIRDAIPMRL